MTNVSVTVLSTKFGLSIGLSFIIISLIFTVSVHALSFCNHIRNK